MMMMCLPLQRGVGFHIGDGDPRMPAIFFFGPFGKMMAQWSGAEGEFGWVLVGSWVVDADLDILDGKLDCHIVYIRAKTKMHISICGDF